MNLPGWDWKENIMKPNAVFTNLHNYFMDIINNNALSQLIDHAKRLINTLDVVLTIRQGKVLRTETIPEISDHDIVNTEFDFRPVKWKQKPRIIPLYNKANWNNMTNGITSILDQLLQMFKDHDCNVRKHVGILQANTQQVSGITHTTHKFQGQRSPTMDQQGNQEKPQKNYTDYTKRRRNLVTIKLQNSIKTSNIMLKR